MFVHCEIYFIIFYFFNIVRIFSILYLNEISSINNMTDKIYLIYFFINFFLIQN